MGPVKVHDFGVELVDLLMGTDAESQVVQTRVALVMRVIVTRRDENHYWTCQKANFLDEKKEGVGASVGIFFLPTLACCPGVRDTIRLLGNFFVAHEVNQQELVE